MSWHTNAVLIRKDFTGNYAALFDRLGLVGAEEDAQIDFDEAASSSNEGIAIATIDGWTALWGGLPMFMLDTEQLPKISEQGDVFEMILEGASGTAGFSWYSLGNKVRDYLSQGGEIINNEGKPLAIEDAAFSIGDEEEAVLQIMEKMTLSLSRLSNATYTLFKFEEAY